MAVTPADIQGLPSGEFTSLSDPVVQSFIDEAKREVNVSLYGDQADDAVKYLAAHLLAAMKKGSGGAAGPVIMEQAGPVSRQYASGNSSVSDDPVMATTYGRRYRQLQAQAAGGPRGL